MYVYLPIAILFTSTTRVKQNLSAVLQVEYDFDQEVYELNDL